MFQREANTVMTDDNRKRKSPSAADSSYQQIAVPVSPAPNPFHRMFFWPSSSTRSDNTHGVELAKSSATLREETLLALQTTLKAIHALLSEKGFEQAALVTRHFEQQLAHALAQVTTLDNLDINTHSLLIGHEFIEDFEDDQATACLVKAGLIQTLDRIRMQLDDQLPYPEAVDVEDTPNALDEALTALTCSALNRPTPKPF